MARIRYLRRLRISSEQVFRSNTRFQQQSLYKCIHKNKSNIICGVILPISQYLLTTPIKSNLLTLTAAVFILSYTFFSRFESIIYTITADYLYYRCQVFIIIIVSIIYYIPREIVSYVFNFKLHLLMHRQYCANIIAY